MKMIVLLKADSPAASRRFYEDELGMFTLQGAMWDSGCTMQAIHVESFGIELTTYNRRPSEEPAFTLIVEDCKKEFARLSAMHFASGARVVPNEAGALEIFEYPAGQNFMMEDPSGNRFVIHEDFAIRGEA
jgi:hypothetical protein